MYNTAQPPSVLVVSSEYGRNVRWTNKSTKLGMGEIKELLPRNATRDIADLARHEERPATDLLAILGQLLQVEELANWHSPTAKQDLVQMPLPLSCYSLVSFQYHTWTAQLHSRQHSKLAWSPATAEKLFQNHCKIPSLCSTPVSLGGSIDAYVSVSCFGSLLKALMYPLRMIKMSRNLISVS